MRCSLQSILLRVLSNQSASRWCYRGLSLDELNIFLVLPSNEAVREAIEAGAGATIISRHVVASAIAAGELIEIPIELPQREYALVLHRDRHATLAQEASARYGYPPGFLARYFEKLRYSFGPRERAGLYTFLEMARDVGELDHVPELRFARDEARAL